MRKVVSKFLFKKGFRKLNCELIKNETFIHGIFKQIGFTKKNDMTWYY